MPEKDHVIVGTAGHIDHGKSALVRALTGTDPDTLPEEKKRGMTIELGFVFLDDPGYEKQIVFIDVPGHEKFVRTMAAGASNIDAALLVIAADEGVAVQTREHFDILQLLGIRLGAVALTKSDLVDEARLAELAASVRSFVRGSFLADAPIIPVSSLTGVGVAEVKAVLQSLGREVEPRQDSGIFRMPIDRVFTIQGFGTVVAGTVLAGTVKTGDRVEVFPEGLKSRVRGVQVHGAKKEESAVGKRTALNLQDIRKDDLRRGQVAAAEGSLTPTLRLDARLDVLRSAAAEVKHRDRIRLHIGTDEVIARVAVLEGQTVAPGATGLVQFILESPTTALPGDRFVIRTFSPLVTIGGGFVLDAAPAKHKRMSVPVLEGIRRLEGDTAEAVEQVFLQSGPAPMGAREAALKLGRSEAEVARAADALLRDGRLVRIGSETPEVYVSAGTFASLCEKLVGIVEAYFEANPTKPLMPYSDVRAAFLKIGVAVLLKPLLDDLARRDRIIRRESEVGLPGREARVDPAEQRLRAGVEGAYRSAKFAPPLEDDVRRRLGLNPSEFRAAEAALVKDGTLVRLGPKVIYHREAVEAVREVVLGLIERHAAVTIAELRDRLNLSRKYAQAVLEYFDRTGLTKRVADRHVLNQRASKDGTGSTKR